MKKLVISYFNKQMNFYESLKVVSEEPVQNIIGSCKRYVGMCPAQEAASCVGKEVRMIGEFDDENIVNPIVSLKEPVLICDCDEILKSRFPQLYESNTEKNS